MNRLQGRERIRGEAGRDAPVCDARCVQGGDGRISTRCSQDCGPIAHADAQSLELLRDMQSFYDVDDAVLPHLVVGAGYAERDEMGEPNVQGKDRTEPCRSVDFEKRETRG